MLQKRQDVASAITDEICERKKEEGGKIHGAMLKFESFEKEKGVKSSPSRSTLLIPSGGKGRRGGMHSHKTFFLIQPPSAAQREGERIYVL